ncbi:MAG: hypothetical protein LQ346_006281 [Caloplaca aetnensis]|nr:MAG: hypothetical protein LQ346_006281 [Caloplaca aetnensis]
MPVDLKGAPTDFSSLPDLSNRSSSTQLPRQLVRQLQGSSGLDIDDRYIFVRELGSGCEGTVRLYRDTSTGRPVAIKVFQSKYRNPLPAHISEALEAESVKYWPAEIPATILLGESALGMNDSGLIADHEIEPSSVDVLPALDYFLIRGSTRLPPALGNVRELRHPYLATSKWHRDGQWADCQANDVRRALLSYLNLIRRAAVDSEAFDQQFLCRSSPLGELYWRFMEQPILAKELQDGLKSGSRETSAESFASCRYSQESPFWTVSKPWVSKRVNLELRWSTAPDKFTFWTH